MDFFSSRLSNLIKEYNSQLDRFHFNEAAKLLYEFTWNDFCDWYIEIAKISFKNDDKQGRKSLNIAVFCIQNLLSAITPLQSFYYRRVVGSF